MPADISTSLKDWSTTAGSNLPTGGTLVSGNLDDNLRAVQAAVRADVAGSDTIASAGTTDIGTKDAGTLTVTGVTTITGLGTVSAGICKRLVFGGVLTLTHNATSLILPSGANITTAAGDCAEFVSLGSGNWRCLNYMRANGGLIGSFDLADGTAAVPALKFTSDGDTGLYRVGANSLGISAGGAVRATISDATIGLASAGTVTAAAATTMSLTTTSGAISLVSGGSVVVSADSPGDMTISCTNVTGSGNGGPITISAGNGDGVTGTGGDLVLRAGQSAGAQGGNLDFDAGSGGSSAESGNILFRASWGYALTLDRVSGHFHMDDNNGRPTVTSGAGTSPTIRGADTAFKLTLGTTPTTTVRITFKTAWDNAPICIAQYQGSHIAVRCDSTTSRVDLIFASAPASGAVVDVICMGWKA